MPPPRSLVACILPAQGAQGYVRARAAAWRAPRWRRGGWSGRERDRLKVDGPDGMGRASAPSLTPHQTPPAPPDLPVPSLQPPVHHKDAFCLHCLPDSPPGPDSPPSGRSCRRSRFGFANTAYTPPRLQRLGHCWDVKLGGVIPLWNLFVMLSDLTIKDASNQDAANTVPFPHFPRSKGEHLPCSHSQIQTSHLGPGLRSICQKLQDPSTENRKLKSNAFSSALETSLKRLWQFFRLRHNFSQRDYALPCARTHTNTTTHLPGTNLQSPPQQGTYWISRRVQCRCGISGYQEVKGWYCFLIWRANLRKAYDHISGPHVPSECCTC